MNDGRAGIHNGPWHETRENRVPFDASASRFGVRTLLPAQPSMSARCWSAMMTTMFGDIDISSRRLRGDAPPHLNHTPGESVLRVARAGIPPGPRERPRKAQLAL